MQNQKLASILATISAYLAMDDVPFKPQAYEQAATAVQALSEDVEDIYRKEGLKGLERIPGVGKSIAEKIEEYIKTGRMQYYEEYRKKIPVDVEELMAIEGIGPKTVKTLYQHLKIKNLGDLERAAKAGKIRKLPHFGEKTEKNILQGIEFVKNSSGRKLIGYIYPYVEEIVALLKNSGLVEEVIAAGSFRRMKETVGDVDILVTTGRDNEKEIVEYFLSHVPYVKIWGRGSTKVSIRTTQDFDIDIRILPQKAYGAALQYFTGSKEHNVKVRTYALQKGLKVSEYGVFRGRKLVAGKTEEEVYKALGLPYIEPELREDQGEFEAALRLEPPKVIPYNALRGDLQVQTNWTDGAHSIEQMAEAATKQGLEYIAITDHTKDLAMTGGCDEKKLLRQMTEIDAINVKLKIKNLTFRILKGAEVNIRRDGTLDIADEVLAKLDVVGASVHSLFKMNKKDMTERIIRAMRNPHVDILFHPTGRIIQKRDPYELDMDEIIRVAKETGTILEVNAYPERLDLKDTDVRKAVNAGVKLVIDSDAHHADHFRFLRFGIAQARRGWAEAKDVVNTLPLKQFLVSLKDRKKI
ncbi:MAG: DNA polymerase/3'-5' exonuclease PolX [Candidatus Wildermuthbacteria bacterium]|nr:DNA polymerase/3'-5' exonuclease PolX [Candidatus Wildermuthbacteria bacterium]